MSVAATYAEALFEAATEADAVDAVAADLAAFAQAMRESAELRAVLSSPEVDTRAKKRAVAELTEGASPLTALLYARAIEDAGDLPENRAIERARDALRRKPGSAAMRSRRVAR